MSTNKPQLKTYVDTEIYNKLKILAQYDGRSISNYLNKLIIKDINEYEKGHGQISIKNLNVIDNNGTINM